MASTIQIIWKSGGTMVITVPKKILKLFNFKEGDNVQVEWNEVIVNKKGDQKRWKVENYGQD